MNGRVTSTKIESVIKKFPANKNLEPDDFTAEFYQTFILLKLFQKIAEEGLLLNSSYESSITLIIKPDKDITKKIRVQYH